MKYILIYTLLILSIKPLLCQDLISTADKRKAYYDHNLYLNKTLIFDKDFNNKLIKVLYSKKDYIFNRELNDSVMYPYKNTKDYWESISTNLDSLKDKEFLVTNIVTKIDAEPFKKSYTYIVFTLQNTTTKDSCFLNYNPHNNYSFPFIVKDNKSRKEKILESFRRRTDDFTNDIHINSIEDLTLSNNYNNNHKAIIHKIISKGVAKYYLSLYNKGLTLNIGEKGVYILLEDGTKMNKPNVKIDVNSSSGKYWEYYAFVPLTLSEVKMLGVKKIKKYRLYIYDEIFDNIESNNFKIFCEEIINIR